MFALGEEIGSEATCSPGYVSGQEAGLIPVRSGLGHLAYALILLTTVFPVGNKVISLPLFYGTVVAASFFYGYLRIYTGSVWPASIAHAVHNAAWGTLGAFTATSYPVIVNKYLAGDYGILILAGAVIGSVLVGRLLMRSGPDEPRPGIESGEAPAT